MFFDSVFGPSHLLIDFAAFGFIYCTIQCNQMMCYLLFFRMHHSNTPEFLPNNLHITHICNILEKCLFWRTLFRLSVWKFIHRKFETMRGKKTVCNDNDTRVTTRSMTISNNHSPPVCTSTCKYSNWQYPCVTKFSQLKPHQPKCLDMA